jgi:predicted nucleotidyltransferase
VEQPPAAYPPYATTRARRLEARRAEALAALREAARLTEAAGGRLVVFGSLAEGGFHDRSDIDVAVCDLGPPADSELAAAVDTVLATAGFEADVMPERLMSPSLRRRVMANGREPGALG